MLFCSCADIWLHLAAAASVSELFIPRCNLFLSVVISRGSQVIALQIALERSLV
jgi:hypothetical protein